MKVAELIAKLQELPPDAIVEVMHEVREAYYDTHTFDPVNEIFTFTSAHKSPDGSTITFVHLQSD